jgi:tubulin polyglutamylase TTLL2
MKTKGIKNDVTLIIKPNTLSRGRGIYLTQDVPPRTADNVMVQHYIERPLLIGGLKFDLRM